jgi:molybdopterin/thiamine biosynthesis adenylyltransferase
LIFARNPKEHESLSTKHVIVVGCGSVGSAVCEMLVRAGLGKLTLIDPETLAPENIGRHLLTQRDLGRPKVEAMKDRLLGINPECNISARPVTFEEQICASKNLEEAMPDLVVSCVDSYRCESLINGFALEKGIPAVYIGCWGPAALGEILYVVPGKTACYECFAAFRKNVEIPADARKYTDPDFDDTRVPGQPGLWANILTISGISFQVILGLFALRPEVIDCEHTLWLANISDYDSAFSPLAVTFARVKKGCAICDESLVEELTLDG